MTTLPQKTAWPLISVVIPSYNQGKFLEETIRSVVDQAYPNNEIIVIDGGSSDESVQIIKRYAVHLRYWVSEPDRGQSHAINKGFALAMGDVFAWLNSDDMYLAGALQAVAEVFAHAPEIDLVYGDYLDTDPAGSPLRRHHVPSRLSYNGLLFHDYLGQPATFFRRRLYKSVGPIDEALHSHMDWDLWLRMWKVARVRHLKRVLATSRMHLDAKTNQEDTERYTASGHLVQRRHMPQRFRSAFGNKLWYRIMFILNLGVRAWVVVRDNPFDYVRLLSQRFPGRRMWTLWRMRLRFPR